MGTVNLNAKDWELRYTVRDAIELKKRLGRTGDRILMDMTGVRDGVPSLGFDIEVLVVCLAQGIRHVKAVGEDKVIAWVQEHVDNNKPIGDLMGPVAEALLESGCFGYKKKQLEADDDAGKEPAPTTST